LQRNVTELMNLQPGVVAGGANLAIRATGAIDDQNTVVLDGIDITQNVVASNTCRSDTCRQCGGFSRDDREPGRKLRPRIRRPDDPGRAAGSNTVHGALYEYLQNSALNSNTWDNSRANIKKAAIRDNRFGGRVGVHQ
jgi:hypothetical protein